MYTRDVLETPASNAGILTPLMPHAIITPKFEVHSTDSQVVQVILDPSEEVHCEPGAMIYKAPNVKMKTFVGGFGRALKRWLGGEGFFMTKYVNNNNQTGSLTLSPGFPSKVVPVDMNKTGNTPFVFIPSAYLGHVGQVDVTFKFVKSCLTGCCSSHGFVLQKCKGTGTVFVTGGGTVMAKQLAKNETLIIDAQGLLGFSESCDFNVEFVGCSNFCCGNEGAFVTKITGPGTILIHSMSNIRFAIAATPPRAKQGGADDAVGEVPGNILCSLLRVLG